MVRGSRWAFAALAWLFVAGIVYQVLLIGLYLFDGQSSEAHIGFGYTLPLVPLVGLIAAAVGRVGRSMLAWAAVLFVLTVVQTFLPPLRDSVPLIAALHPVNAMLIFWMAASVAWRSIRLAQQQSA
jgi:uncharacterized membrane protein